jgi:hypothetical protein
MSTYETAALESAATDAAQPATDERPENCDCGDWNAGLDLPCWPCYRAGFDESASADSDAVETQEGA